MDEIGGIAARVGAGPKEIRVVSICNVHQPPSLPYPSRGRASKYFGRDRLCIGSQAAVINFEPRTRSFTRCRLEEMILALLYREGLEEDPVWAKTW